jgi:hypothetical protein
MLGVSGSFEIGGDTVKQCLDLVAARLAARASGDGPKILARDATQAACRPVAGIVSSPFAFHVFAKVMRDAVKLQDILLGLTTSRDRDSGLGGHLGSGSDHRVASSRTSDADERATSKAMVEERQRLDLAGLWRAATKASRELSVT